MQAFRFALRKKDLRIYTKVEFFFSCAGLRKTTESSPALEIPPPLLSLNIGGGRATAVSHYVRICDRFTPHPIS